MIRDAQEIKSLALKYSKPQLAHMAQMGMIDTQKAVLAAMMRDRIAKEDAKPPTTTVAQDVLGMFPQIAPPSEPPQMGMAQAPAPQMPEQMAATGGLTSIPVKEQDYAGGGIVAFADGGDTGYEYKFNPDTGEYTLIGEKKKEVAVDTRKHLGAAGLGIFGSEGMDLMTGLPKGNMRDPVLGFADGGVAHFDSGGFNFPSGSLLGMFERRQSAGGDAVEQLQNLDTAIAQTPPGPALDRLLKQREFLAPKAAAANTQSFAPSQPTGVAALNANAVNTSTVAPTTFPAPVADAAASSAPPSPPRMGGPKMPAVPSLPPIGNVKERAVEEYKMPANETIQQALGRQEEADKAAGVDTGIFEKLRGEYEGKKGKVNERKQEAIGMAIMQTGLGLMGASKGRELASLGESGQRALSGLVASNEKIRDYEEKLEDKQRDLLLAQNDYNRNRSKSAQDRVQRIEEKTNELANKTVEAKNKRAEHEELIASQTRGQDITARGQDLSYRAHMAQIGQMARPGETERLMAQYQSLYAKDPAAAAKWLENLGTIRGIGKPQNTFSFEEAMKLVAAKPQNINATPQELSRQARELMAAGMQPSGVTGPRVGGAVDTSNPLLK